MSNDKTGPYQVVELSQPRRLMISMLNLHGPAHVMYGLLEVDVTDARRIMAAHRERTGETLSFTGFLVYCLARAVDENKAVQSYLKGGRRLVQFEDVNVAMMIEQQAGEKRTLKGHVVRSADRKTFRQIHDEIRRVQSEPAPPGRGMPNWLSTGLLMPWPLSAWFRSLLGLVARMNPTIVAGMAGTVSITAVGMFGRNHSGWGLFEPAQSLEVVVGSIATKPAVHEGRIEPREILHLTVALDHEVIDGGPAARFTHLLVELIESAAGLEEEPAGSETGQT